MNIVECRICPVCNLFKPKSLYKTRRRAVCADCFCDNLTFKLTAEKNRVVMLRKRVKELKSEIARRKAMNNNARVEPNINVIHHVNQNDDFYDRIFINVNR